MVANASFVPPDNIRILTEGMPALYSIEDFFGFNLVIGFEDFPTFKQVKKEILEMLLISLDIIEEEKII